MQPTQIGHFRQHGYVVVEGQTQSRTKANATDRPRAGAAYHFLHEDCFDRPAHEGRPRRNPVLTGPNASDGTGEYGERIAGTWPRLVEALARGAL